MNPRPVMPQRYWLVTLLCLCLTLPLPPLSHAEEPVATAAPAASLPPLQFRTDLQTDCRSEFQSTGTVDWQPGRLTLQPGATISKAVYGNWQASWQFEFAAEPLQDEETAEFVFQVEMDKVKPWLLVWKQSFGQRGSLTLFDMEMSEDQPKLQQLKQRRWLTFAGTWQIDYSASVLQVRHNGTEILFKYWSNGMSAVKSSQLQCKQHRLILSHWQQQAQKPRLTTKAQRQQIEQANQLMQAGVQATSQKKYADAESKLQHALAIYKQTLGQDYPHTADSLRNLALLYQAQRKFAAAEPLYHRVLAIHEQCFGSEHPITVTSLQNLAALYHDQRNFANAEPLFLQALAFREQRLSKDHPDIGASLNGLAVLYLDQGKYTEAEPLLQRALAIGEQRLGKDHPNTATALNGLASLYRLQGKYADAEPLFLRALAIGEQRLGKKHPDTALSLNNLATLYRDQGKYSEAEPLYQRALAIREQTLGKEYPDTAKALNNLASLYYAQGKYAEAEPLFLQAIQINERNRNLLNDDRLARSQNEDQFIEYRNLTKLYLRTNRSALAWQVWESSLGRGIFEEFVVRELQLLSVDEQRQRRHLQTLCQSYMKLIEDAADKPGITQAQRDEWQQQYHRHAAALSQWQRDLAAKQPLLLAQPFTRTDIQTQLLPHQALVGWLDDEWGWHYGYVVRSTGLPFWIKLPGKGEKGQLSPVEVQLASQVVYQLSAKSAPSRSPSDWQQLTDFLAQLQQQRLAPLQPALAEHDGLPAATHLIVLPSEGMAGVPIETLVDAGTLVSYASSGTVFAWLRQQRAKRANKEQPAGILALGDPNFDSTPKPQPTATATAPSETSPQWGLVLESVNNNGAAAQAGLKADDVILNYNGIDVYQFDELANALQLAQQQGIKEVPIQLWRPDGAITVKVPTGSLGIRIKPEPIQPRPTQDLAKRAVDERWRAGLEPLEPLPGTRREVAQLQRLAQQADIPATILLGSDASEQKLYELAQAGELKQYRYLHFATHGAANDRFYLQSKLFLARDQLPDPLEQLKAGQPVFRGELTAEKILKEWNLNAELAVLSACQTGLGQFKQTEGFLGLSQPFLLAGTQSVVVSLWNVSDTATQLLMIRFYENLWGLRDGSVVQGLQPMNKIDALHEAKQWLRTVPRAEAKAVLLKRGLELQESLPETQSTDQPFAHPHYWAAFILVGDWQ